MESGYLQGQSDNLPKIDSFMLATFYASNADFISAELRGVKAARSSRGNYGDNAIGYVQVKRDGPLCHVKARVTPEHRLRIKPYTVALVVDEQEETVKSCVCQDCAASEGGCKHAIAFLSWVHRRSEDPPRTSVECYWKKSKMAAIGTSTKFIKASDMGCKSISEPPRQSHSILDTIVSKTLELGGRENVQLIKYFKKPSAFESLTLYNLLKGFDVLQNADEFIKYCSVNMDSKVCRDICDDTKDQSNNAQWHKLRYGRITASKLYEVAHCHTDDGSLLESILGGKIFQSDALERGLRLEKDLIKELENLSGHKYKSSGLIISPSLPIFGASPDGVCSEYIIEIKCPTSIQRMKHFLKDGQPSPKYNAQMQLQMHLAKKDLGLYCVAYPDFELTNKFEYCFVSYDSSLIEELIMKAESFWKKSVFPKLIHSV